MHVARTKLVFIKRLESLKVGNWKTLVQILLWFTVHTHLAGLSIIGRLFRRYVNNVASRGTFNKHRTRSHIIPAWKRRVCRYTRPGRFLVQGSILEACLCESPHARPSVRLSGRLRARLLPNELQTRGLLVGIANATRRGYILKRVLPDNSLGPGISSARIFARISSRLANAAHVLE